MGLRLFLPAAKSDAKVHLFPRCVKVLLLLVIAQKRSVVFKMGRMIEFMTCPIEEVQPQSLILSTRKA